MSGEIELIWGSGLHLFKFGLGQFRALQDGVNRRRLALGGSPVGPMDMMHALRANNAWPDDVRDILRIGLIGGGMSPRDAHVEMTQYFDDTALLEHMQPAMAVLLAGLAGPPGEAADGKKKMTAAPKTVPSTSL